MGLAGESAHLASPAATRDGKPGEDADDIPISCQDIRDLFRRMRDMELTWPQSPSEGLSLRSLGPAPELLSTSLVWPQGWDRVEFASCSTLLSILQPSSVPLGPYLALKSEPQTLASFFPPSCLNFSLSPFSQYSAAPAQLSGNSALKSPL